MEEKSGASGLEDESQTSSQTCRFFLKHKNRYCKFEKYRGTEFCVHHVTQTPDGAKKVPCPLDPRHSIFEKDVERHVGRCPAQKLLREQQQQPYFLADANLGPREDSGSHSESPDADSGGAEDEPPTRPPKRPRLVSPLYLLPSELFADFVTKIESAYAKLLLPPPPAASSRDTGQEGAILAGADSLIETAVLDYPACHRFADGSRSASVQRHIEQESSLIAHLDRLKLLDKRNTFVEFGCGKGELSVLLHQVCEVPVTMIDRVGGFRNKADRRQSTESRAQLRRLTVDLKDVRLAGLVSPDHPLVGFSKHLCGEAADLTVRAVQHLLQPPQQSVAAAESEHLAPSSSSSFEAPAAAAVHPGAALFAGLVIANCCHQRCTWANYANQKFIRDTVGLSPEEFKLITNMSGWATAKRSAHSAPDSAAPAAAAAAAAGFADAPDAQESGSAADDDDESLSALQRDGPRALSWSRKEELGFKGKRLLDFGRIALLRELGLESNLVYFVPQTSTPENCLMYAVNKSSGQQHRHSASTAETTT